MRLLKSSKELSCFVTMPPFHLASTALSIQIHLGVCRSSEGSVVSSNVIGIISRYAVSRSDIKSVSFQPPGLQEEGFKCPFKQSVSRRFSDHLRSAHPNLLLQRSQSQSANLSVIVRSHQSRITVITCLSPYQTLDAFSISSSHRFILITTHEVRLE